MTSGCGEQALRLPPPDGGSPPAGPDAAREAAQEAPVQSCFAGPRTSAPSGSTPAGDLCLEESACQYGPDEFALCQASTEADVHEKLQRCHRLSRGKLGDACALTLMHGGRPQLTTAGGLPFPAFSKYCALADGLECDPFQRTCVAVPKLGETCPGGRTCAPGSFCDHDVCVAPVPLGSHCTGANDFMEQPECVAGAHCEIFTDTCVPALPEGSRCDYDPACISGACVDGTCAPAAACPR